MDDGPPLLRPLPRRPFELNRSPADSSPTTPPAESSSTSPADATTTNPFSRSRSILNLTSSTLFGIYQPTGGSIDGIRDSEPPTPWGTGAETPARGSIDVGRGILPSDLAQRIQPPVLRRGGAGGQAGQQQQYQHQQQHQQQQQQGAGFFGPRDRPLLVVGRTAALFAFGVTYGVIITHLHDNRDIVPVPVQGLQQRSWSYLAFWGLAGVVLGSLLPVIDVWFSQAAMEGAGANEEKTEGELQQQRRRRVEQREGAADGVGWNAIVRSVGAFVGIAFAIRKTPWRSTLQASATLALVNPALWYLLDRSSPGFLLSTVVGIAGSAILLLLNPGWIPSPAAALPAGAAALHASNASAQAYPAPGEALFGGWMTYESIVVATWIASVLFCSSICFGNIGRRLR